MAQILEFLDSYGGSCGAASATGNNPPAIAALTNRVIPHKTPFELTAVATDAAGQTLSYAWEQIDPGLTDYPNAPYIDDNDTSPALPITTRPVFRPFAPGALPMRMFPSLDFILNSSNTPTAIAGGLRTAESLSGVSRALNFRVTVRDGLGGVRGETVQLEVVKQFGATTVGPFKVTAPNSTGIVWQGGSTQTVTWDVNNTDIAPVNCSHVRLKFSANGGQSFDIPLNQGLPVDNTGSALITVPNIGTTQGRIRVEAVNNVFFDVSDANFTVESVCSYAISPLGQRMPAAGGAQTLTVNTQSGCSWIAENQTPAWITITSVAAGTGNGTLGYSVAANPNASVRIGTLIIAGREFIVVQEGTAAPTGLLFYPLLHPVRLLDTRAGQTACHTPGAQISGNTSRLQPARGICDGLTIPSNAAAITGNITTVLSGGGFLTLYPSDATLPTVANSNYGANEVLNNVFTVGLGASDGAFKIFVTSDTDVVVDVTGYYAPPGAGGLYFHPLSKPIRLLETRAGFAGCTTPNAPLPGNADTTQQARLTCDGVTIPSAALAIVGNATTVNPSGPGNPYLTLFPADAARPLAASSNYLPGQVMNAPFTVGLSSSGAFKIYPTTQTELIVDVLGYYSAEASDVNGVGLFFNPLSKPVRLLETRAGLGGCDTPGAQLLAGSTRTQVARGLCNGETISSAALGVVGNATVVNAGAGYLTFWPSNVSQPLVAASNFNAGQVFNRHFIVGLGNGDGAFKIFASVQTDLVVDVSCYFAP